MLICYSGKQDELSVEQRPRGDIPLAFKDGEMIMMRLRAVKVSDHIFSGVGERFGCHYVRCSTSDEVRA